MYSWACHSVSLRCDWSWTAFVDRQVDYRNGTSIPSFRHRWNCSFANGIVLPLTAIGKVLPVKAPGSPPIIIVALGTGMRLGEILNLE
jgi:hypothetical protein